MSQPMDRAGAFRGQFHEYGMKEERSGALAVVVRMVVQEMWDHARQAWIDWAQYDMEVVGYLYIIKKDGTLSQGKIKELTQHAGWNGDIDSLGGGLWSPTLCQVEVKEEEYDGNVQYRIAWIHAYDSTPGAVGNVSAERAKELQTQFGSQVRALVGSTTRNATAPAGKPPTRYSEPAKPEGPPAEPAKGDIPF